MDTGSKIKIFAVLAVTKRKGKEPWLLSVRCNANEGTLNFELRAALPLFNFWSWQMLCAELDSTINASNQELPKSVAAI